MAGGTFPVAIRRPSRRRTMCFEAVNCSVLARELSRASYSATRAGVYAALGE
jgi:hypothetical protein